MPPTYWMVTNRTDRSTFLGPDIAALSYWVASDGDDLTKLRKWRKLSGARFRNQLIRAADSFQAIRDPEEHERQKHVTLFIHGYNTDWTEAVVHYRRLCERLFSGPRGLGLCVLFSWPSDGMKLGYLPDRADAERSGPHLLAILSELYDWLLVKQAEGAKNPRKACRAKTSLIAHSMGNYVLQKAMQHVWTRKNQPLLVSLINQLLMVAADVDNDLFKGGEQVDRSDGDAIAHLTYRVTALYSGRDAVLGLSAGFKHFGKRRLGRSGLDPNERVPDNVWGVDCSELISPATRKVHSAYFNETRTLDLMREVLCGVDRRVLVDRGLAPAPRLEYEELRWSPRPLAGSPDAPIR